MAEDDERDPENTIGYRWLREPAVFCDTHYASYFKSANIVRITFGEYIGSSYSPYYRAGVALPLTEAKRLVRTLQRLVREAEEPSKPAEVPTTEETPKA
jgi:hypothetical protein